MKLNAELDIVEHMWNDGDLPWGRDSIDSLVEAFPHYSETDSVLERQGDIAGHYEQYDHDVAVPAASCEHGDTSSSDSDGDPHVYLCDKDLPPTAPAKPHTAPAAKAKAATLKKSRTTSLAVMPVLSVRQAQLVHHIESRLAGLESAKHECVWTTKPIPVQKLNIEISKLLRQRRAILNESPEMVECFQRKRESDHDMMRDQQRMINDINETERRKKQKLAEEEQLKQMYKETNKALHDLDALIEERKLTGSTQPSG